MSKTEEQKRLKRHEKAIKKIEVILRRKNIIEQIGMKLWRELLDIVTEATKPEEADE